MKELSIKMVTSQLKFTKHTCKNRTLNLHGRQTELANHEISQHNEIDGPLPLFPMFG